LYVHVTYIPEALDNQSYELLPIHIRIREKLPAGKRDLCHILVMLVNSVLERARGGVGGSGAVRESIRKAVGGRTSSVRMTVAIE
jgi:hypothetical protein